MPGVIALKWWSERVDAYPIHLITERHPGRHPEGLALTAKLNGMKCPVDYITAGMNDGNRIWGFNSLADVEKFKKLIGMIT